MLEKLPNGELVETGFEPKKILCLGLNYMSHIKEMGKSPPSEPIIFMKPSSSLIGHEGEIVIPKDIGTVHHEIELAVIVGWKVKEVEENRAMDYVYGYAVFIDVTARDVQARAIKEGLPWLLGKGLDTFAPISHIVCKDYVPDPHNLALKLWVNGKLRQSGNTKEMVFKIPYIISYISRFITLEPGDIIATGTPSGVGIIKPGDIIEAEIENIGKLRVKVSSKC